MYDGKNKLKPVQKRNSAINASIVDIGSLIWLRSGPTPNLSFPVRSSPPNSIIVEDIPFRSWVSPTRITNLVPSEFNNGYTINVKAGIIGITFCSAKPGVGVINGNNSNFGMCDKPDCHPCDIPESAIPTFMLRKNVEIIMSFVSCHNTNLPGVSEKLRKSWIFIFGLSKSLGLRITCITISRSHQIIDLRFLMSILTKETIAKIVPPIIPKYKGRMYISPNSL